MSDDELLRQAFTNPGGGAFPSTAMLRFGQLGVTGQQMPEQAPVVTYRQWQAGPNESFRAAGVTVSSLPAAIYAPALDAYGPYLEGRSVVSDDLIELPDHVTGRILAGMERFWASAASYRKLGLVHKRGLLLWGPQGSGKTVTVSFLMKQLIARDGIVLLSTNPNVTSAILPVIRRIEPDRPLVIVMEDIDEIIGTAGEHEILAMLDGEKQIDNVVHVATTNHPERLGARILNRPSRFDERLYIGMPSAESRLVYLHKIVERSGEQVDEAELMRWRDDTEGLSVAHLRELAAALICLKEPYASVIERLRALTERPSAPQGFAGPDRPAVYGTEIRVVGSGWDPQ